MPAGQARFIHRGPGTSGMRKLACGSRASPHVTGGQGLDCCGCCAPLILGGPMTPFMHRVQALLDGGAAPRAVTAPSEPRPVPVAIDSQVIVRSLAEQLVSEANAALRDHGDLISLDDE